MCFAIIQDRTPTSIDTIGVASSEILVSQDSVFAKIIGIWNIDQHHIINYQRMKVINCWRMIKGKRIHIHKQSANVN